MASDKNTQQNQQSESPEVELLRIRAENASLKVANQSKDDAIAARERELNEYRNGKPSTSYRTTTRKPTWPFLVTPFNKELKQLNSLQGEFIDESEAIRCFWVQNAGAKGTNKQGIQMSLDSTNVHVNVVCLKADELAAHIRKQYVPKTYEQLVTPAFLKPTGDLVASSN